MLRDIIILGVYSYRSSSFAEFFWHHAYANKISIAFSRIFANFTC